MELLRTIHRYQTAISVFRAYTYADLARQALTMPYDLYCRDGRSCPPLNIALFVTVRCNARCTMCNLRSLLNDPAMADMPLPRIAQLLDQVQPFRPSFILFGGEPTLRPDLPDIIRMIRERGMSAGMFTNGLVLDRAKSAACAAAGLDYVAFSLQGTAAVHDRVVGCPGTYARVRRNLEDCLAVRGRMRVVVHATATPDNAANLPEFIEELQPLGLDAIRIGHPTFFAGDDRARQAAAVARLFPGEPVSAPVPDHDPPPGLADTVIDIYRRYRDKVLFTPELDEQEIRDWYSPSFRTRRRCLFAWRGLFILPNGDVMPCESLQWRMGNVFVEPFAAIWNSQRYVALRRQLKKGLLPACARCCKL